MSDVIVAFKMKVIWSIFIVDVELLTKFNEANKITNAYNTIDCNAEYLLKS